MKALKYYLAVEKLKHFQYRANDVSSLKDLSLLISEVKSNIYRHDFLRNEYETRLTSFKKYRDEHMEAQEDYDSYKC